MGSPADLRLIIAAEDEIHALSTADLAELFGGANLVFYCDGLYDSLSPTFRDAEFRCLFPRHLVEVDSRSEHIAFERAIEFCAETARRLRALLVSGVHLGTALAFDLMRDVQREWMLYQALAQLASRPGARIAVWSKTLDPALQACLLRLKLERQANVSECVELRNGVAHPGMAFREVDRLSSVLSTQPPNVESFSAPAARMVFVERDASGQVRRRDWIDADQPVRGSNNPVHFFIASRSNLQIAQAIPILKGLSAGGHPTRLIYVGTPNVISLNGSAGLQEVAFAKPATDIGDAARFCAEHLKAAALSLVPLSLNGAVSLVPLFLGTVAVSRRLQAVVNAAIGAKATFELRPRSAWVPNAVTSICQAIIAASSDTPVFSGFAATVSEHIRNLPFIEPRVTILGYGSQLCSTYRARGLDPDGRIILTGGPQLDDVSRGTAPQSAPQAVEKLRILVVTARMRSAVEDILLLALLRWAQVKGHKILIKLHPTRPGDYTDLIASAGATARFLTFLKGDSAAEALRACDIVISDASTSSIMAGLLRLPLIQIDTPDSPLEYNDLSRFGISLKATGPLDLIRQVKRLREVFPLADEAYAGFDEAYNVGNDGQAGERCANVLASPPRKRPAVVSGVNLILSTLRARQSAGGSDIFSSEVEDRATEPLHAQPL